MAGRQASVLRQIDRLWNFGTLCGMTDAQLLARFAARHEGCAELAFEALVQRHGPMVFRVCRGVLQDEHAAEDAFQATFLVLARKVHSLSVKDSLGGWLHSVAHRVATRARSDAVRRRRHELRLAEARGPAWVVMPDRPPSDAAAILSEEIARLPEKYRAPIVLCYLEAMSYATAAGHFGVTEDAARGRLARARERLRRRLAHVYLLPLGPVFLSTHPDSECIQELVGLVQDCDAIRIAGSPDFEAAHPKRCDRVEQLISQFGRRTRKLSRG
jgi:HlyD family secretion protein